MAQRCICFCLLRAREQRTFQNHGHKRGKPSLVKVPFDMALSQMLDVPIGNFQSKTWCRPAGKIREYGVKPTINISNSLQALRDEPVLQLLTI